MSTLREPYRIEGKKTMGIELAEQLGWRLPTHVVYPTGGGTGLIGMWKVFAEMRDGGWLPADARLPRMIVAQADGCAPIVRAFDSGATIAPSRGRIRTTHASGLRVPGPLGDRLILRALRESGGDAACGERGRDPRARRCACRARRASTPRRKAAVRSACCEKLVRERAQSRATRRCVLFNTGSGASYRF